jgi:hypothetical protein
LSRAGQLLPGLGWDSEKECAACAGGGDAGLTMCGNGMGESKHVVVHAKRDNLLVVPVFDPHTPAIKLDDAKQCAPLQEWGHSVGRSSVQKIGDLFDLERLASAKDD